MTVCTAGFITAHRVFGKSLTGWSVKILCLLPTCLWIAGFVLGPAPADPTAVNEPAYHPLVNGRDVLIEAFFVNGQTVPGKALEKAIEQFDEYVGGQATLSPTRDITVDLGEDGTLSKKQLENIVKNSACKGQSAIPIIIAPDI